MNAVENVVGGASQFPFWDFVECNHYTWVPRVANPRKCPRCSQFPLWDFCECNLRSMGPRRMSWRGAGFSLNSLCGISSNATFLKTRYRRLKEKMPSQFPFWDFVQCNSMTRLWLTGL
jgi:hypothetical protein